MRARPSSAPTSGASAGHPGLDDQQLLRYSRHILLPEFGLEAQEKLAAAQYQLEQQAADRGALVRERISAAGAPELDAEVAAALIAQSDARPREVATISSPSRT